MIKKAEIFLKNAVDRKVFPGCVAGIVVDGKAEIIALGRYTYENSSREIEPQSVFDVASITKAIPVSCLSMKLIEEGKMRGDDVLVRYVPEYNSNYADMVTIDHLLTQTLQFDFRLSDYKSAGSRGILDAILKAPLKSFPGEKFFYANATSILLGMAIERCTYKRLDILADEMFFKPLKMESTTLFPSEMDQQKVVPTEFDPWRGRLIQGEIHDESAWALRPDIIAGSAGLFSNVPDLLKFVTMLLDGGLFDGTRIFKPETISLMHTNQRPKSSGEWCGLGWELNQKSFMGRSCTESAFGKTGFTGCSIVMEPRKRRGLVLLTNHVHPSRRPDRDSINQVRSGLADIVWGW